MSALMVDIESIASRSRFFTICASNYLAQAAVLGRSIAAAHRGARLTAFLLDSMPADRTGLEHLNIVSAEAVMAAHEWRHRLCYYDILELATSIKPACFLHLFQSGCSFAIYLDPDIWVFKAFDAVFSAFATGHDAVLTPHLLSPLPADGRLPDDLAIMRSGTYNLGFAAFADTEASCALLQWWDSRLHRHGLADVNGGMFTDQRWVDLLSAFLPKLVVLRDPGYNIAYWNLHERTIRRTDSGWRVTFSDGTESDVVFFHFSGFSPKRPELSKHENRFQDRPPGDVGQLLTQYAGALGDADFDRLSDCRVPVPRFDSGPAWDPVCRTLYRNALRDEVDVGDPLVGHSFLQYAADTDEGETLPRYLVALLQSRSDLAEIYAAGGNARGLRRWLARSGRDELKIDAALLQALGLDDERPSGVNYVGYLRAHLGVGQAARNAIAALGAAGVTTAMHDISDTAESPQGHYDLAAGANLRNAARHPITILGVNADQTPLVLRSLKDDLRATFLIGSWAWETPEFPEEWCDRFDLLDEVWVGSQFVAKAVRAKSTIPVTVVPYMVSPPRMERDRPWLVARVPDVQVDEFVFLFLFDIASEPFRKNPEGAIAAFTSAFGPDERVHLIVKTLNGDRAPVLLESLARMGADHRVTIWDEALDTTDRFRLLASVDALVSLHRAEGFGLTIAEAMAYGLPVVTTAWSGNVDFANADNAALVNFDLIKTDRPHGPYPAGTLWAEPRLADAARQMRRVRDDAAWRACIGVAAAATIAAQLSPTAVGAIMRKRIDWLSNLVEMDYPRSAGAAVVRTMGPVRGRRFISASAAIAILMRDLPRRPLFYLSRAHRLPRLLMGDGFRYSVHRGATFARTNRAAPTPGGAHATSPLGGVKLGGVKLNVQRLFRHLRFKMPL